MARKILAPKIDSSRENRYLSVASLGSWLELSEDRLLVLGPDEMFAIIPGNFFKGVPQVWADPGSNLIAFENIAKVSRHSMWLMGTLNNLSGLDRKSISQIKRRHPGLLKANYLYFDNLRTCCGINSNHGYLEVVHYEASRSLRVRLAGSSVKQIDVFTKPQSLGLGEYQASYLTWFLNMSISNNREWKNPQPWYKLLSDFGKSLSERYKKHVCKVLISQLEQDFSNELVLVKNVEQVNIKEAGLNAAKNLGSAQTKKLITYSRQAWWLAHGQLGDDLLKLASGLGIDIKPARQNLSSLPKSLHEGSNQLRNLNLPWFNNFLKLKPYQATDDIKTPVNIEQALSLLHHKEQEVSAHGQ